MELAQRRKRSPEIAQLVGLNLGNAPEVTTARTLAVLALDTCGVA